LAFQLLDCELVPGGHLICLQLLDASVVGSDILVGDHVGGTVGVGKHRVRVSVGFGGVQGAKTGVLYQRRNLLAGARKPPANQRRLPCPWESLQVVPRSYRAMLAQSLLLH
jgi:hypothetical protein